MGDHMHTPLAKHANDAMSHNEIVHQSREARSAITEALLGLGAIYANIPRFLYAEQEALSLREFSESLGAGGENRVLCRRSPQAWLQGGGHVNIRDELLALLLEGKFAPVDLKRLWSLYCKVTFGLATRAFSFSFWERDRLLTALMAETITILKHVDPHGLILKDEQGLGGADLVAFLQRNNEALLRVTMLARLEERAALRAARIASAKEAAEVIQRLFIGLDRDPQGFYE